MKSLVTGTGILRFYADRETARAEARNQDLRFLVTHEFSTEAADFSYEISATNDFSEIAGNPEYLEDGYGIFDIKEGRPIWKNEVAFWKI